MKKNKHFLLFLLLPAFILLLTSCDLLFEPAQDSESGHVFDISVMLVPCEGMVVTSENPVRIIHGGNAVFSVDLEEGVELDELPSGAYYDNAGHIVVTDVRRPTTITVSLKAEAADESTTEQDTTISTETPVVIPDPPEDPTPTTPDDPINPNEKAPDNKFLVIYHANGGKTLTTSGDGSILVRSSVTIAAYSDASFYLCPNALANRSYFERTGYALIGYNTKPDGSGDYYGCGWNIIMPQNRVTHLYAMWAKYTPLSDFSFTLSGSEATIQSYRGNDDMVVIPEYYGQYKVTTIRRNAFAGAQMTTLYITKNIKIIQLDAFKNCTKLQNLYLCDNFDTVNDDSFSGCDNLTTLYLQAVSVPKYTDNHHGTYSVKYERLYTSTGRRIFVAGGSNTAFGVDSPQLMRELSFDATVINFGFNWQVPITFQLEIILAYARADDILLLVPELTDKQFGNCAAYATMWQLFESCYEAVACVDMKNYTGIFNTLNTFNTARRSMPSKTYDSFTDKVNEYGDYSVKKEAQSEDYAHVGQMNIDYDVNRYLTDSSAVPRVQFLNSVYDAFAQKGCYVWMSFPSVNRNGLTDNSKTEAYQKAWEAAVDQYLHVTIISSVSDYIYPGNYFFNSNYHLCTDATKIRTSSLANDINAAFAKHAK